MRLVKPGNLPTYQARVHKNIEFKNSFSDILSGLTNKQNRSNASAQPYTQKEYERGLNRYKDELDDQARDTKELINTINEHALLAQIEQDAIKKLASQPTHDQEDDSEIVYFEKQEQNKSKDSFIDTKDPRGLHRFSLAFKFNLIHKKHEKESQHDDRSRLQRSLRSG